MAGSGLAGPYEHPAMRETLGTALRPGGLAPTSWALDQCALPDDALVLDAGCGRGASLALVRERGGMRAVGLDPSSVLLAEARAHGPVLAGRAESLPFSGGQFHAVLCECVLSLVPEPEAALAEFARVLRPDGRLILADLYRKSGPVEGGGACGCADGAVYLEDSLCRIERAGFHLIHVEIRDKELKELAARLILAHGSLQAFWGLVCPDRAASAPCEWMRLGYHLVIAQKDGP